MDLFVYFLLLFPQAAPSQSQSETGIQSELLPDMTSASQSPHTEHIASPPSTVDTAALSEEPLPVKAVSKPGRPTHICTTCNKQFKNNYNLRRHQSVHTGIKMKDRAAREREELGKGGVIGGGRQTIPLSLLHLPLPPSPCSSTPATITAATPQVLQAAVVVASTMVQVGCLFGQNYFLRITILFLPFSSISLAPTNTHKCLNQNPQPQPNPSPSPNQVRKNHACEACGKAFRDVYHLNRHRLSHSDEKPYHCPICQQRFKRKDRMSYHVRSHQGGVEKPYVCPHCAKGFSRPDHLNSHVRQVHSTERPFKCPTCTSAFATKDRLRAHLIRHEEKVPCHICGKLLSAAYITDHMRVHNQSQHHSCHLCNRSFTTLTYLRVHAQKHHGQEWKESGGTRGLFGGAGAGGVLLCQLCGIQCKTPTQLQGHMGTHATSQGQGAPSPSSSSSPAGTGTVAVSLSSSSTVGLLVTDCSSINPQPPS
uniref:C2H2-type domain-containing protein n=1 Tax=Esox lucius TaxID=8010 RepID=A0A3P9AQ55_ESOLU